MVYDPACFYFGCWGKEAGHYLWTPRGNRTHDQLLPADFPVAHHSLDGSLLPPRQPEAEGRATHVHVNGWTIISFWDRSGDSRGKSNSAFIARGLLTFEEIVGISRQMFPQIWQRFTFQVVDPTHSLVS